MADDQGRPNAPQGARPMKLEIDAETAKGRFVNAAIVTHTEDAFFIDFALAYPRQPVRVLGRMIMSPQHAKALLRTLADNVARFEKRVGEIPERPLPNVGQGDTEPSN
ncbi:hypothetical protein BH23DEI1_BH23DEI1_21370 [soil metagenome]|nr:DUF3467 domain-containing protein [Trueperaceae bacterium]